MAADRNLELALRISADLSQATSALKQIQRSIDGVGKSGQTAAAGTKQQGDAIHKLLGEIDPTYAALSRLSRLEQELSQQFRHGALSVDVYNRSLDKIRSQRAALDGVAASARSTSLDIGKLARVIAGAFVVRGAVRLGEDIVQTGIQVQQAQFTLQAATGSAQKAGEELEYVRGVSEKLGLEWLSAAKDYSRLVAAAKSSPELAGSIHAIFESVSEASRVLHFSGEQTTSVLLALQQMMSKGKVQSQELVLQLGQAIPGALDLAAKAMGVTTQQLYKMAQNGSLLTKDFLPAFARELHEAYGADSQTAARGLQAEINRLKNAFTDLKVAAGDGGFLDAVTESVRELGAELKDPTVAEGFTNVVQGMGAALKVAVKLAQSFGGLVNAAEYFARQKAAADTGYIDQGQSSKDQQEEFDALVDRHRANLEEIATLEKNSSDPKHSYRLRALKEEDAALVQELLAAQEAHKQAIIKGQAEQQAALKAGAGDFVDSILNPTAAGGPLAGLAAARAAQKADAAAQAQRLAAVQNSLKLIGDAYRNADKALEAQHKTAAISDQTYYDGLRTDLDTYEAAKVASLEREKTAASAHIKTQADRIKADQAAAAIDTQITQVHADAATKRQQIDAQEQQAIQKSRQDWEALKRSFETPAEVRADTALEQIAKLTNALRAGVITAQQYNDALGKIGQHAVDGALPTYQGVDAAVGGPFGELQKNFAAEKALNEAHQSALLALKDKFRGTDEQHQQAYLAAKAELDTDYAQKSTVVEQSRQQLLLTTASNLFGQLATLSSSHNKRMAAIGKAAAISQTIINTYQSATEAYKSLVGIPVIGPGLATAAAAVAIAAGLANVAEIRAQPTGGYSSGGYTGPGGKYKVAGWVHAGEGVLSQEDIRALGGPAAFETLRKGLHGYADGGFVHPLSNVPAPPGTAPLRTAAGAMLVVPPLHIEIHSDGGKPTVKQGTAPDGGRMLEIFINAAAAEANPGGKIAKNLQNNFVLQRKGSSYG